MTPRAPAMPPEERRRSLIAATLPLLRERGGQISTAEIARAAGVAEGTIFRVFESKDELLGECVAHAMDPAPLIADLAVIDCSAGLERRLVEVVRLWQARVLEISGLMAAMYATGAGPSLKHRPHSRAEHQAHSDRLVAAIAEVIEPDADQLTLSAAEAASLVRSMAFATSHPMISDHAVTDPELVVRILLHGMTSQGPSC
ncbi:TetR/AcrR family transcriptional regulator [Enemella dayhoffiae]|nr:TetR/AcrR family transcriptional regulator [Enemella dayhoffiae]